MTTDPSRTPAVLIFSIDSSTERLAAEVVRLTGNDQGTRTVVGGAGEAIRCIHRDDPHALIVCVGHDRLDESAALIDALHRRRPKLPLLAITGEYDQAVERAARAAGATCYLTVDGQDDLPLRRTLESLGFSGSSASADARAPCDPANPRADPGRTRRILNAERQGAFLGAINQTSAKDRLMLPNKFITRQFIWCLAFAILCFSRFASAQFNINFDEKGIGTVQNTASGTIPLQPLGNIVDLFDPGNGLMPLAYNVVGTINAAPIDGDITLISPSGGVSDLLRFYHGFLYVYSDLAEPGDPQSAADVGLPALRQANAITLQEMGPEPGLNGLFGYIPAAGGPGQLSAPSTYNFISDPGVPEPTSLAMFGVGAGSILLLRRRR